MGFLLLVNARAEYPDQDELIKKENEIYFYPEGRESKDIPLLV